jgi:hypothetical protein
MYAFELHKADSVATAAALLAKTGGKALAGVFAEIAAKFQRLVDALNDVSEMSWRSRDRDVLRLYEVWLTTGSPRAHAPWHRSTGPSGILFSRGR